MIDTAKAEEVTRKAYAIRNQVREYWGVEYPCKIALVVSLLTELKRTQECGVVELALRMLKDLEAAGERTPMMTGVIMSAMIEIVEDEEALKR